MERPIGGYFELEQTCGQVHDFLHKDGVLLNTGHNALEYVLTSIGNIKKVYIPYYTCIVVLESLKKLGIAFNFYRIDHRLEIAEKILLHENEYIIYTNYFGVKDVYVNKLASSYGEHLIVDCAQALFFEHINGIKTIYSPRKFVGIPDGGVAYIDGGINPCNYNVDESDGRMAHLYIRREKGPQAGYATFQENEKKLSIQPIKNMSLRTKTLLENIDFNRVKEIRRRNFRRLHKTLAPTNKLIGSLSLNLEDFTCPMVYPYWTEDKELKSRLIKEQVFVASYWPNVLKWTKPDMIEYEFANNLLAIPCDQRYGEEDMNRIIRLILS